MADKRYTREWLEIEIEKASRDMKTFYKKEFINYRGKTSDTKEYYTEVVAKYLCKNIALFNEIPMITRKNSYFTEKHNGQYKDTSNREEEKIAMDLYNQCKDEGMRFDIIGTIIDYQTPLKDVRYDEAGKIDLLAYDGQVARILELKKPQSEETMLRCVLEGYTYWKTLDKEKCIENFSLPADTDFEAAPFVFENSKQQEEYNESTRENLHNLMDILKCKPIFIKKVGDKKYEVVS